MMKHHPQESAECRPKVATEAATHRYFSTTLIKDLVPFEFQDVKESDVWRIGVG